MATLFLCMATLFLGTCMATLFLCMATLFLGTCMATLFLCMATLFLGTCMATLFLCMATLFLGTCMATLFLAMITNCMFFRTADEQTLNSETITMGPRTTVTTPLKTVGYTGHVRSCGP